MADNEAEKRLRWAAKQIDSGEDISPDILSSIVGKATEKLEAQAEEPEVVKLQDIKEDIEKASKDFGKFTNDSISTGFQIIDRMIGGLKPSEITIICANPNVGKSWLCSDMAVFTAAQVPTLFITLEMRAEQLGARMKIHAEKALGIKGEDWDEGLDIYFQRVKSLDYRSIGKLFDKAVAHGIKCVFLDYLQYLGVGMDAKEMAKISRMFHELALVHNIPIVIVASLRKDSTTFKRKWYDVDMFEISGVGAISYDADNILCVGRTDPENNDYTPDHIWVKHIKSRNMPRALEKPYGKLLWLGGAIKDDEKWWNEEGKFYPYLENRPVKVKANFADDIKDDDIQDLTEFERRKLKL